MSSETVIITIKRSSDPTMIELWSCGMLWAVVNSDLFYPQIDLLKLIGSFDSKLTAQLELRIVGEDGNPEASS